MILLRNTLVVLLTIAFLNVTISKSLHEFLEHDHMEHTCDVKDQTHFHQFEFQHHDVICSFQFTSSFLIKSKLELNNRISYFQQQVNIAYQWLTGNIYLDQFLLRGPPFVN
ncbi:MAG: hypothetical protein KDD41_04175 [Flavobacteriales bacterium]|nr:hypothetical protein [Flavobacteriales bacterium]